MAVNDLNLLTDADISERREEGKNCRERRVSVNDEERHVVDLEAVGQVANTLAIAVRVRDDDDLVAAVNQLAGELIDVGFDASRLREEKVADHGDVVRAARHGVEGGREGRIAPAWL